MDDSPAPSTSPPAEAGETGGFEQRLWSAAIEGRVAHPQDLQASFDNQDNWVRGDFVRFLAIEKDPTHKIHERGVRLRRLRIIGKLDLSNCEVRRPLRFEDCLLDDVDVTSTKLATLSFVGSTVGSLTGDRCAAAALFLRQTTVRRGTRLLGAQIAGDVDCQGATLAAERPLLVRRPGETGADVDGLDVALGLDGAAIGGAFFLRRATLVGRMSAASLTVGKVLDAREMKAYTSALGLDSAIVGGDADFGGAFIGDAPGHDRSPHDIALNLGQARIGGTLRLGDRFRTDRGVLLNDLRVSGNLTLRGARLVTDYTLAIVAQRMQVDGTFDLDSTTCFGAAAAAAADAGRKRAGGRLAPQGPRGWFARREPPRPVGAALDLTAAQVGSLSDQWADWPCGNRVLGFRYEAIVGATSTRAEWWVHWLKLQVDEDLRKLKTGEKALGVDGFKPQPWDQAILALRAAGCLRDAEDLAIAKETAEYAHDKTLAWPLHRLWGVCAGYGYRPLRLLWALPVVYLASVWIYSGAAGAGAMAPTKEELIAKDEYQRCHPEHGGNWSRCALAPGYPDFNAWAYALQTLLPAIELRQAKDWAPVQWQRPIVPMATAKAASGAGPAAAAASGPHAVAAAEPLPPVSGWGRAALYWSWFEGTLGLAAPVLVGLALTGLIRRKLKD